MNLSARRRRLFEYLRYRVDNYFTRGPIAQLTLLAAITALAMFLGALAGNFFIFAPDNKDIVGIGRRIDGGFLDALWWSAMHFLDPSYVSQNYGATFPVIIISIALAFLGFVFFGTVIGFISADVARRFEELAKGNQPVRETGHILILGWNEKIYDILDLFEDYRTELTLVILSNHPIEGMRELIRTGRTNISRVKPILRTGSLTNLYELQRVAAKDARSIIVLSDSSAGTAGSNPDISTVKTLMLLARHVGGSLPRPKIVAEIVSRRSMNVARIACQGTASLVCASELLGRTIVQAARQPGLSQIYGELFGFRNNEIFIRQFTQCNNRPFGDLTFEFPDAILIGTSSREETGGRVRYIQHINPGDDYVVGPNEWLILFASKAEIEHRPSTGAGQGTRFMVAGKRNRTRERMLILGWNDKVYQILRDFDTFLTAGSEVKIVALHSAAAARDLLGANLQAPLNNLVYDYACADPTDSGALSGIAAQDFSICIILADESSGESDLDARSIMTLLLLHGIRIAHPERNLGHTVAEVGSTNNLDLLHEHPGTAAVDVVSPKIISMLLSQLSQQLMLEGVYADLMSAGANEVYLMPIKTYVRRPGQCTFRDIMMAAAMKGEVAIGLKIAAESSSVGFGIKINPPKTTTMALDEADQVVVLARGVPEKGAEEKPR